MGVKTELLTISIYKAHIGKNSSAQAAADVETHSVPVLSFLQTNRRLELSDLLTWHCLRAPGQLLKLYCPHNQIPTFIRASLWLTDGLTIWERKDKQKTAAEN